MSNNWKIHLRATSGDPSCGQRLQVNLSLTNNPAAVTCKRCMPFASKADSELRARSSAATNAAKSKD